MSPLPLREYFYHVAMADAIGSVWEFRGSSRLERTTEFYLAMEKAEFPEHCEESRFCMNRKYTDDTEMTLANASAAMILLKSPTSYMFDEWSQRFAEEWVQFYHRGGRRQGYSRGFRKALESVKYIGGSTTPEGGRSLINILKNHGNHSEKNGAAMRAPVLGVLVSQRSLNLATLALAVISQTRPTHDSDVGYASAWFAAYAALRSMNPDIATKDIFNDKDFTLYSEFLNGSSAERKNARPLYDKIREPIKDDWTWDTDQDPTGIRTMRMVHHILQHETTIFGAIRRAVWLGGDVDTVAAISAGILSPRCQGETFPDEWVNFPYLLENGSPITGHQFLTYMGNLISL